LAIGLGLAGTGLTGEARAQEDRVIRFIRRRRRLGRRHHHASVFKRLVEGAGQPIVIDNQPARAA
jgi:hypothetical protein